LNVRGASFPATLCKICVSLPLVSLNLRQICVLAILGISKSPFGLI
jgi:hypothetical protein